MATSLEFEAKNVEKALSAASAKLKKTKEDLKYEIISYGSTGIFGLVGIKKAKIRVTIEGGVGDAGPRSKPQKKHNEKPAATPVSPKTAQVADKSPAPPVIKEDLKTVEQDDAAAMEKGLEALNKVVGYISEGSTVEVASENELIDYHVSGGESSRLIGKRGQTLEAIQYIIEKIVNQGLEKRIRVRVDIEDYLKNKEIKIIGMAEKLAEKAKKTGKPVSMGQLNANDRRIVHIALKNDSDVRTQSRGQSFYRKLIIFPREKETLSAK